MPFHLYEYDVYNLCGPIGHFISFQVEGIHFIKPLEEKYIQHSEQNLNRSMFSF